MIGLELQINAPVAEVWRYLSEPALMAEWMVGIDAIRTENDVPVASGTWLISTAGGKEHWTKIVGLDPQREIALQSVQKVFAVTYIYRLRPAATDGGDDDATIVTLSTDCEGRGLFRVFVPMLRTMINRVDSGQLASLRHAIESQHQDTE